MRLRRGKIGDFFVLQNNKPLPTPVLTDRLISNRDRGRLFIMNIQIFRIALDEAIRRAGYFTDLWLKEKDPEFREKYWKHSQFYNRVIVDLSEKFSEAIDGKRS